jgi:cytochrome c553
VSSSNEHARLKKAPHAAGRSKNHRRRKASDGIMNVVAKRLSDANINSLAAGYAAHSNRGSQEIADHFATSSKKNGHHGEETC